MPDGYKDKRPDMTPMHEASNMVAGQAVLDMRVILESAYEAVKEGDGPPEEVDNDAISVLAHLSAYSMVHVVRRLVESKGITIDQAFVIASKDVMDRLWQQIIESAEQAART